MNQTCRHFLYYPLEIYRIISYKFQCRKIQARKITILLFILIGSFSLTACKGSDQIKNTTISKENNSTKSNKQQEIFEVNLAIDLCRRLYIDQSGDKRFDVIMSKYNERSSSILGQSNRNGRIGCIVDNRTSQIVNLKINVGW